MELRTKAAKCVLALACSVSLMGAMMDCLEPCAELEEPLGTVTLIHDSPPQFSQDNSLIVFSSLDRLTVVTYVVSSDGSTLYEIPEGPSPFNANFEATYSPSISPDGSRVIYSTLRYADCRESSWKSQLATSELDGKNPRRLETEVGTQDPAWSPDGSQIAFSGWTKPTWPYMRGIYTMSASGSGVREIVPVGWQHVWSHDGRHLAFIGSDEELDQSETRYETVEYFIATVRADGSEFRRIFESESQVSVPSWSPDSSQIALLAIEDESEVLYIVEADGTGLRPVFTTSRAPDDAGHRYIYSYSFGWSTSIWWSPDGSEIRFFAYAPDFGLHSIRTDGSGFRTLQDGLAGHIGWSSDGSRMVVYQPPRRWDEQSVALYTSAPDGSDRRDLVRYVRGALLAENPEWRNDEPNCSSGRAVSDPDKNPGLVRDCEILLSIRDTLAGEGVELNWRAQRRIESWEGIWVEGSPPRVEWLIFPGPGTARLAGSIPPELGGLTGLNRLWLSEHRLTGSIPPELGNLVELESLLLSQNRLTGPIPPQLGNLVNLRELILDRNELTGDIPPELGNLKNLKILQLSLNNLTGCVPRELSGQIDSNLGPDLQFCEQ